MVSVALAGLWMFFNHTDRKKWAKIAISMKMCWWGGVKVINCIIEMPTIYDLLMYNNICINFPRFFLTVHVCPSVLPIMLGLMVFNNIIGLYKHGLVTGDESKSIAMNHHHVASTNCYFDISPVAASMFPWNAYGDKGYI